MRGAMPPKKPKKTQWILLATLVIIMLVLMFIVIALGFWAVKNGNSQASSIRTTSPQYHDNQHVSGNDQNRGEATGLKQERDRSQIYRLSKGFEFLHHPGGVIPGGRYLNLTKENSCSFGWTVVSDEFPGVPLNLTAGHCGDAGDKIGIQEPDGSIKEIGEFVWTTGWNGKENPDWALIKTYGVPVQSALPIDGYNFSDWVNHSYLNSNKPYSCSLGFRSGISCGEFIEMTNEITMSFESISDHGDSGGPIWVFDPNSNKVYAAAVNSWGESTDATAAKVVLIEPVMQEFGLKLVVPD